MQLPKSRKENGNQNKNVAANDAHFMDEETEVSLHSSD